MLLRLVLLAAAASGASAVVFEDKWQIFCGVPNCYDELGLLTNATKAQIRKSYRKLSMDFHPDKNPGNKTAAERFRRVARANEVLTSDEDRKKLDYYTENQAEYWFLYGNYVEEKFAPKMNPIVAVLFIILFFSVLQPAIQFAKNKSHKGELVAAALKKTSVKAGGFTQALEVRKEADEAVKAEMKARATKPSRAEEKQLLEQTVARLVDALDLRGEHRPPALTDVLIVKLVRTPIDFVNSYLEKQKLEQKISAGEDLTEEEKQVAIEFLLGGPKYWDALTDSEQDHLIDTGCWEKPKFEAWAAARAAKKPVGGLTTTSKRELRQRKKPVQQLTVGDD